MNLVVATKERSLGFCILNRTEYLLDFTYLYVIFSYSIVYDKI